MWELASGQAVGCRFQRRDCKLPLFLLHSSLERMKVTSHRVQSALGMTLHSKRQWKVLWRHSTEQWLFSKWIFCTSLSLWHGLQVNQVTKGEREREASSLANIKSLPLPTADWLSGLRASPLTLTHRKPHHNPFHRMLLRTPCRWQMH